MQRIAVGLCGLGTLIACFVAYVALSSSREAKRDREALLGRLDRIDSRDEAIASDLASLRGDLSAARDGVDAVTARVAALEARLRDASHENLEAPRAEAAAEDPIEERIDEESSEFVHAVQAPFFLPDDHPEVSRRFGGASLLMPGRDGAWTALAVDYDGDLSTTQIRSKDLARVQELLRLESERYGMYQAFIDESLDRHGFEFFDDQVAASAWTQEHRDERYAVQPYDGGYAVIPLSDLENGSLYADLGKRAKQLTATLSREKVNVIRYSAVLPD